MKRKYSLSSLVLFIGLLPSLAFALAGFAERTSTFHYNDFTRILRGHPSDICSGGTKWCLSLERGGYSNFKGIDSTFKQLNIPSDKASPFLIGQRSSDNVWFVYDLQKEIILIADIDYKEVIDLWHSLGLRKPTYVNARNTRELLAETKNSITFRWRMDLLMWAIFGLLPVIPFALFFWYVSRKLKKNLRKKNQPVLKSHLMYSWHPYILLYTWRSLHL